MKALKHILTFLLVLSLSLLLFACGQTEETPGGECKTHVDKNADGICDTCKKEIKQDDGGDDKCDEHVDETGDGYCDVCGECYPHVDDDDDNYCDYCGACIKHTDEDEDGICDDCEEEIEDKGGNTPSGDGIALIEGEEVLFQIVLGSDITSSIRMNVDDMVDIFDSFGMTLKVVEDKKNTEADLEILIGTVSSRGEDYEFDKYSLGAEGYIISALDESKIIISGGSEEALVDAFTLFFEEYLGISEDADYIDDFTFAEEHEIHEIQSDYRVTSVSVNGTDIKGYTISRDRADVVTDALALRLQKYLYEKAGYYLKIVDPEKAGDKTISFRLVEKGKAGNTGFRVVEDGDSLIIECAHKGKFEEAFNEFYSTFSMKQGDVNITKFNGKTDFTTIYYSDFGVKGDGKTDDSAAIRAAHNEANANNQTVVGDKNAVYYIGKVSTPILIKTDVDWRGAKFIFDASEFQPGDSGNVFKIDNDSLPSNFYTKDDPVLKRLNESAVDGLVFKGINHGEDRTTKIDVGIREPLMLKVFNSDARVYIRWGYTDTAGGQQCEVVIVDENGNIDESTPFLLDYPKVTSITAYKIDVDPITVKNATVESRNSLVNLLGAYKSIAHSIEVARPNVTVENLKHVITQEYVYETPTRKNPATGLWEDVSAEGFTVDSKGIVYQNGKQYKGTDVKPFTGFSYSGFIQISNTHNTLVKNCVFQARYHYEEGTYDISCSYANKILFKDCTQSNFFEKDKDGNDTKVANIGTYWGISGTNYCKNMYYEDCVLTRYDAHCGVYNGGIKGGKISVLRLIGGGTFTIDGTEFYARSTPIQLREDYGATFNGNLIIKDTEFKHIWGSGTNWDMTIIDAPTANIYNGYGTYFPSLEISNIKVETTATKVNLITLCNQTYSKDKDHFPARCPIRDNTHDPEALFTYYYETENKNVVEENPEKFPFLEGRKKNTKATSPSNLADNEYMVVDNGNGTYTVIANKVKNLQPYHAPEYIKVDMSGSSNVNGKPLKLTIYKSNFFDNTEIIDEGKAVEWIKAPAK